MIYQFQNGGSWFHRLDPGSKFIWLVCVSVLSLSFESAAFQAALFLTVFLFALFAAQRSPRTVWRALRLPFWFGVPYFLLQLLFVPGEQVILSAGPLQVTSEALNFAAAISMRLITLILASFVWIATTDPRDAVLALAQQLRVPYKFAFAVSIALRFLPILETEAASVRTAQRLRGFGGAPARQLRRKLAEQRRFVFTVFVNAVRRVRQTAETMESRAFGLYSDRTYRRALKVPASATALTVISVATTLSYLLLASTGIFLI